MTPAEARARDGFVQLDDLRLHYRAWGHPPGAHTIVLLHGLGSTCHIWDLTAPVLAERYRVLALDQRGHGESDQPERGYDFPSVVGDLASFLDAVGAPEPMLLVGHSWGASVVLHFAVEHPDRTAAIALVDGGTGSPGERWTWDETLQRLTPPEIDGLQWTDLSARMASRVGDFARDPRVQAIHRSLFQIDAEGRIRRRFRIPNHLQVVRALWEQRPSELLPRLSCPVLLLPARLDADAPEARAAQEESIRRAQLLQPRARLRWFDQTVHDIPLQRPDDLAAELIDFADRVWSPRAAEERAAR